MLNRFYAMFSDENNGFRHGIQIMFRCPILIAFTLFDFSIGVHINDISDAFFNRRSLNHFPFCYAFF